MPPPMTSSRSGMPLTSSAPVESTIRSSSGRNGSDAASEPAAMMQCSKPTTVSPTLIVFGQVNSPVPRTTWTLRCLASDSRPPVSRPTTPFFNSRTLSTSIFGASKVMPASPSSVRLGHDLGDVQQRLGRDAADVQADAAELLAAVDQGDADRPRSAARNAAV